MKKVLRRLNPTNIHPHAWAVIIKAIAFAGVIFIIFMLFRINAQNNDLATQAKNIAEQNQRNAKANGRHIDCIAETFARFTREQKPITIDDLEACQVTDAEAAAIVGGEMFNGAVDFTRTPEAQTNPNRNDNTNQPNPQGAGNPNTQTPPEPNPPVEVLGVPVCVPLTNVCVRQ